MEQNINGEDVGLINRINSCKKDIFCRMAMMKETKDQVSSRDEDLVISEEKDKLGC